MSLLCGVSDDISPTPKVTMSTTQLDFNAQTRFFTIATAGHVDHGKTSLLRKLTGMDPDRLKEEKERQMTTDLGFAYMTLPSKLPSSQLVVGFVDVPGHGKFLKNMLAGVGGIDIALLVVAADEGPMPQTKQHVRILSLLGVNRAIVAITKVDLVEEDTQIEIVQEETEKLLREHGIEVMAFCPLSSTTGAGVDALIATFSEVFLNLPEKTGAGSLFLPVDRVFSKSGFGTVITGTLVTGHLKVGDQIHIEPGDLSARVRRLETHGQSMEIANPGQRVACNLVVKDGEKLKRGFVLSNTVIHPVKSLIVSLFDKPRLLKAPLSERLSDQPIRLYHGTAEYHGYVRWVEDRQLDLSEENGSSGQSGIAFVALQDEAVVSAQDKFVIRLTDDTIYGGAILLRDRPRWLAKSELLKLGDQLNAGAYEEALQSFLNDAPQLMMKEDQLSAILPESEKTAVLRKMEESGKLVTLGDFILSAESRKTLAEKLIAQMTKALATSEDPSEGVTLEALRQLLQPKIERSAFQSLIQEETQNGNLIKKADKLTLPGHPAESARSSAMDAAELQLHEQLNTHWCLEFDELAQLTGLDLKVVKSSVQAMVKRGEVLIVSYDFVASAAKINQAHQILADIWNKKRSIAPTDFREALETTRKYAMALLQYFDDQKITRRLDSGRVLLKGPAAK